MTDKQFDLTHIGKVRNIGTFGQSIEDAAANGWDNKDAGVVALDALEVGQTVKDDDGDTWERIA